MSEAPKRRAKSKSAAASEGRKSKILPGDIRYVDEFRDFIAEGLSSEDAASRCYKLQEEAGLSREEAARERAEIDRGAAERRREAKARQVNLDPIDFAVAHRKLFPWAAEALVVAPARWAPEFLRDGAPFPSLPIDRFVARALAGDRHFGPLRPQSDVRATGFDCFYLAARAGVYCAAVAAARSEEVLNKRRQGAIAQLKDIEKAAQSAQQTIGELRAKASPFALMPLEAEKADARLLKRRGTAVLRALDNLVIGERGCASVEFLALDEIERFTPPRKTPKHAPSPNRSRSRWRT